MSELMLVNPRRRARKATRRRTRVRRHMTALQRKYFGPRRARRHHRRRRVETLAVNPRRRHSRRRHHRRISHLRRNPRRVFGSTRGFINSTLVPAGVGALGALGVDLVIGYGTPYMPASLQSGMMLNAVKIAGAVGVGWIAGMIAGKKFGEEAMAGAITVTLYDIVKGYAKSAMPTLPLSGYSMGWVSPAPQLSNMGMYVGQDNAYSGGMGMYVGESEAEYNY
ncbi:MAG: hypothetical protein KGJ13_10065 [Patescibacteria group bacterium]|nr:hypothetical protein [Patescibacteria group bacterium]